jgi:hypothetical protein
MAKRVEIILGPDGSIDVEAMGFKGASCKEATAFLDKLFGEAAEEKLKESYYEEDTKIAGGLPSGWCG